MRTLIEVLAGLAILANVVIHGTDVFSAIVRRRAIAAVAHHDAESSDSPTGRNK